MSTLLEMRVDELEEQNEALTAQLVAWNAAFDHLFAHCLSNGVFNAWGKQLDCTLLNNARSKTPQQHLAEIRAQAGRDGFIAGVRQEMLDKFGLFYHDTRDRADQYAENILKGELK